MVYVYFHYSAFVINFLVNCFALFIIITKTPINLRNVAAVLLNILGWNFAGNIIWGLFSFRPLFPLNCYEMIGPFHQFMAKANLGNTIFNVITVLLVNACVAVVLSFQFRWMKIVLPDIARSITKAQTYYYCFIIHASMSVLLFWLSQRMFVYPESGVSMFCFTTDSEKCLLTLCVIVIASGLGAILLVLFTLHSFKTLTEQSRHLTQKTIRFQRKYLRNLIILAAVSIGLGAIPGLVAWTSMYLHFERLNMVFIVAQYIIQNHGTILALTVMATFTCYRNAVIEIMGRWMRTNTRISNTVTISVVKSKT